MLDELRRHNAIVQERIMKSFGYKNTEEFIQKSEDVNALIQKGEIDYDFELEKAVYADTAENRKLGRVGQEYHRGRKKTATVNDTSGGKKQGNNVADKQHLFVDESKPKNIFYTDNEDHGFGYIVDGVRYDRGETPRKGQRHIVRLKIYSKNGKKGVSDLIDKLSKKLGVNVDKKSFRKSNVVLGDGEKLYEAWCNTKTGEVSSGIKKDWYHEKK